MESKVDLDSIWIQNGKNWINSERNEHDEMPLSKTEMTHMVKGVAADPITPFCIARTTLSAAVFVARHLPLTD